MYIVNAQRISTMRLRLGEASDLIDDNNFLPMFRNRQKRYPEEFTQSIKIAKTKKNPKRYFAKIWGNKMIERSLEWLRGKINRLKSTLADLRHQKEAEKREEQFKKEFNPVGRAKLDNLIKQRCPWLKV